MTPTDMDALDHRCAVEKLILVVIPEFPQYAADVSGNIWRLHNGWQTSEPRICKPYLDQDGYPTVRLKIGKKYIAKKTHALVCMAFYGPRPSPKHETRHLNGIKTDNRKANLIWGTTKENYLDKIRHGQKVFGRDNPATKLDEDAVQDIFRLYYNGITMKKIAAIFKVGPETIRKVLHRKTWANVEIDFFIQSRVLAALAARSAGGGG